MRYHSKNKTMKKIFTLLFLSFALVIAASCNKEQPAMEQEVEEVEVTLSFATEDAATKAVFGTGSSATVLEYRLYILQGNNWNLTQVAARLTDVTYPKEVVLHLANNMTYRIACFAQSPAAVEAGLYDVTDFDDIAINYSVLAANSDMGDAFCATRQFTVTAGGSVAVVMRRPLAQVNVFSGDLAAYVATAVGNPVDTFKISFKDVPNKFGIVMGDADDNGYVPSRAKSSVQDVTFQGKVLTNTTHSFNDLMWDQFSMNYLVADPAGDITTVDLEFKANDGTVVTSVTGISNVPYKSNYRTNLYGYFITNVVNFTIDLDPIFYEPDYDVLY